MVAARASGSPYNEVLQELFGDGCYLAYRLFEDGLVSPGRLAKSADLPNVLKRRGTDVVLGGRRFGTSQGFDASTHAPNLAPGTQHCPCGFPPLPGAVCPVHDLKTSGDEKVASQAWECREAQAGATKRHPTGSSPFGQSDISLHAIVELGNARGLRRVDTSG